MIEDLYDKGNAILAKQSALEKMYFRICFPLQSRPKQTVKR